MANFTRLCLPFLRLATTAFGHEVSVRHWLRFRAAVTGDPTLVVDRLLAVLDKHDVVRALDRLKRRRILRLVE